MDVWDFQNQHPVSGNKLQGNVYRYVVTVRKKYFSATESLTFPDKASGRARAKAVEQEMLEQSVNAEQNTLRYESAKSRSGDITLHQYLEAYCRKVESLHKESQAVTGICRPSNSGRGHGWQRNMTGFFRSRCKRSPPGFPSAQKPWDSRNCAFTPSATKGSPAFSSKR